MLSNCNIIFLLVDGSKSFTKRKKFAIFEISIKYLISIVQPLQWGAWGFEISRGDFYLRNTCNNFLLTFFHQERKLSGTDDNIASGLWQLMFYRRFRTQPKCDLLQYRAVTIGQAWLAFAYPLSRELLLQRQVLLTLFSYLRQGPCQNRCHRCLAPAKF